MQKTFVKDLKDTTAEQEPFIIAKGFITQENEQQHVKFAQPIFNHEIEEEKEVPNEHPDDTRKITPTRNGCNVTARKGFSFENSTKMQLGLNEEHKHPS